MGQRALLVSDSGRVQSSVAAHQEGTCRVQRIAAYPKVEVSAGGAGVVSPVGSRLLAGGGAAGGGGGCWRMWPQRRVCPRRSTTPRAAAGGVARPMLRVGC